MNDEVNAIESELDTVVSRLTERGPREAVEWAVCNSLTKSEQVDGVWIGRFDPCESEICIDVSAGPILTYLEAISPILRDTETVPAARAIRKNAVEVEPDLADSDSDRSWRDAATRRGFRSAVAIPIVSNEICYGALSAYSRRSNGFDEPAVASLVSLGTKLGDALVTITSGSLWSRTGRFDIRASLPEVNDPFLRLAKIRSTSADIDWVSSRPDGTFVSYLTVHTADSAKVRELLSDSISVSAIHRIADFDPPRFEVIVDESPLASTIHRAEVQVYGLDGTGDTYDVRISLPPWTDFGRIAESLEHSFDTVEYHGYEMSTADPMIHGIDLLEAALTKRQREILLSAYFSGFFDHPRRRTGGDIAESLGISQPAFAKQLRIAQRKLLSSHFDAHTR